MHPIGIGDDEFRHVLGTMVASAKTLNKTSEAIKKAYPAEARYAGRRCALFFGAQMECRGFDAAPLKGIYAIGAPEMLQPYLDQAGLDTSAVWQDIKTQSAQLTDRGLRVLLIAHHPDPRLLQRSR